MDTEIEVSRRVGETISTLRVTKQRDLQAGEAMPFSLEVVTLAAGLALAHVDAEREKAAQAAAIEAELVPSDGEA